MNSIPYLVPNHLLAKMQIFELLRAFFSWFEKCFNGFSMQICHISLTKRDIFWKTDEKMHIPAL